MADLKLTADFSDLQTLRRELIDIPKKARDSARTFEAEFARVERILVKQAQQFQRNASESQKYYSELLKLNSVTKSAEQSAQVFARELEKQDRAATKAGNAAAKLEEEFRKLSLSNKSAEQSARAMEQGFRQLEQAAQRQAQEVERSANSYRQLRASIDPAYRSQQQLLQAKRTIRQQLEQNNITMAEAVALMRQYRAAQVASDVAVQRSNKGLARSGVVMQQTGYQVGDFLVQVQSGTNAFVAFGQQATQLAGLLTMSLNPKIVALGVGLSILIPLTTAIAAAFMRTNSSSNDAAEGVQSLADRLRNVRQEMANTTFEVEALRRGFEDLQEFAIVRAIEEAQNRVAELKGEIQGLQEIGAITAPNERDLLAAEESLRTEQERLENYRQQRSEQGVLTNNLQRQVDLQDVLLEREQSLSRLRIEALLEAGRIAEQGRQTREEIARGLQEEAELYRRIAQFGKDSVQVEELRAQQARAAHLARIQETTTNGVLIRQAMERYDAMVQASEEAGRTQEAMERIAGTTLGGIVAQVTNLAAALGVTADEAARALGGVRALAIYEASRGGVSTGRSAGPGGGAPPRDGQFVVTPETEAAYQEHLNSLRRRGRTSGGGGGGSQGPDAVERLQQEIAFRQRILNLAEDEKELQIEIRGITESLGEDRNKYSSDFITNLAKQNLAIQEQERVIEEARQQQEQLAESISNSFGNAFMSIVEGTESAKDAFRTMAADIIRELYRVLVVERMVQSIKGSLLGKGGAGGILSKILPDARESGGSMMAGRPYLVGERGPELVIPGRSATVANADLTRKAMGGESINIVNNINVSGGTDPAAIRMEVAKLMPQITNATKTAVIDARRRGGQMKAAFQ